MKAILERLRIPRFELSLHGEESRAPSPVATFYLIAVPALILMIIGLMMAFSSQSIIFIARGQSPYVPFVKPLLLFAAAIAALVLASSIPAQKYYRYAGVFFIASILLQLLVITPLGASEGGNTNWIHIPGMPFLLQPAELVKLTVLLAIGRVLDRPGTRLDDWKQVLVIVGAPVLAATGAIMLGRDLGTTIVLFTACLGALIVIGLPAKWFRRMALLAIPVLVLVVFANPTRVRRIMVILPGFRPERDLSAPEQIDHALWAFGSGGVFGLGPGASREKWNYLQAAHTDFILAIVGEEFGLLGSFAVLSCFVAMLVGMFRLSASTKSLFQTVVVSGVATWIGVQAIINVAAVSGLGPVIGVPLPFVSSGGSALVFTAAGLGVVLSIARAEAGIRWSTSFLQSVSRRDPRVLPKKRSSYQV